jgi:hypothetical protein
LLITNIYVQGSDVTGCLYSHLLEGLVDCTQVEQLCFIFSLKFLVNQEAGANMMLEMIIA